MAKSKLENRITQKQRIFDYLFSKRNLWVSCRDIIMECRILQYSARIWQLRHEDGYEIQNETRLVINKF